MTRCLELDLLVSVGTALRWQPEPALRHLTDCDECRGRLHELASLYGVLAGTHQPDVGFTDSVMRSMKNAPTPGQSPKRRVGLPVLLNALLAAATAFFAVGLAGAGTRLPEGATPGLIATLVVGVGTTWWNWSGQRRVEDT